MLYATQQLDKWLHQEGKLLPMRWMDAVCDTAAAQVAAAGGKIVANVMEGCCMRHSSWTSGRIRREGTSKKQQVSQTCL